MDLLCLGLNHTTAPVSVLERVAFGAEQIAPGIELIKSRLGDAACGGVHEAMILSTCNRTEIYCACEDTAVAGKSLSALIEEIKSVPATNFEPHTYQLCRAEAARHVYRVVSGIDSMVLGETQIVGQFKKAVAEARRCGGLGLMLNHLFQQAFSVAKQVRSSTAIGSSSVSLAAAAVRLSMRLFGALDKSHVLFVGAGEMIELCAAHFSAQNPASMTVANRSLDRGQALADRYTGQSIRLQDLPGQIDRYDIIVSCTASALPIIGYGMIERSIKARRHRPICIVDLAVPRDVEPEVSRLNDVFVYTMDELGAVVAQGKESRQNAVVQADAMISGHVHDFERWLAMRDSVPSITTVRSRAELMAQGLADKAKKAIHQGQNSEAVIDELVRTLTHKLIHDPTVLLRDAKGLTDAEREHVASILSHFYSGRGL